MLSSVGSAVLVTSDVGRRPWPVATRLVTSLRTPALNVNGRLPISVLKLTLKYSYHVRSRTLSTLPGSTASSNVPVKPVTLP